MTPAEEEARFIALWTQGVETAEIARQLGLKVTTAQSRAYRLQQRGLIRPRPRGGNYPSLRVQARHDGAPPPARAPAPAPHPRVDIEQWTVRLSKALIERIKAEAAAADKPPSHLPEELVWQALNDRRASTPERREP